MKRPDLKSLFANVKETAKTVTKEEVNNVEKSIDPKDLNQNLKKRKKSSNIKIDRLLEDEKLQLQQNDKCCKRARK